MKAKNSVLNSEYIIDGILQQLTPAEILDRCLAEKKNAGAAKGAEYESVVDESTDPDPSTVQFQNKKIQDYLAGTYALMESPRKCPMAYSGQFAKSRTAKALLDAIWMKGHFRLSDLTLQARWRWETEPLGNMAAFYASVEAAADYIDSLGICLSGYSFSDKEGCSQIIFKVGASEKAESQEDDLRDEEIDLPGDAPFGSEHPMIRRQRAVSEFLVPDPESWLIFIPFDSCDLRLGYSLLTEAFGQNGDTFPEIGDADYFIDCFEILREFVEDGVVLAGATVTDGGLLTTLKRMCPEGTGASVDVSGIMNAYKEESSARVLFSEIPGALIQIKDIDYDYLDAEFLLQDIAYYPVGHPVPGSGKLKVKAGGNNGITDILQSLLNSQAPEGED